MTEPGPIAVVGAGVIGSAVAYALAREGRKVLLLDPAEPGVAGASFGNVGHIAAELVEPLPSPSLLLGFWRELTLLDGPLSFSARRLPAMLPWIARFAAAAFRRAENTKPLAPLVRESRSTLDRWLREVGRPELLRCNGHYEIWLGARAAEHATTHARAMERLGVATQAAPSELVNTAARLAKSAAILKSTADPRSPPNQASATDPISAAAPTLPAGAQSTADAPAGLWFPETGHVADPLELVRAFAAAAVAQGAEIHRARVRAVAVSGDELRISTGEVPRDVPHERNGHEQSGVEAQAFRASAAVICTGAWESDLLEPFGLRVPLESARGYHVEMPGHEALVDAPVLYSEQRVVVTPMSGRLRASSYMEFAAPDAPPDPRRPKRLREKVRSLGYDCPLEGPSWVGPRPVLPDYLPGIGRVHGAPNVFYAIGHQHIGLTLAAVTGDLVADVVAGREPRHDISAFDLKRFG